MDSPIIECKALRKDFVKHGKTNAVLRDVNLIVREKEVVVVAGKSGEGKTVLLWLIAQLDKPTGGTILFRGEDLSAMSRAALAKVRREEICMIFQDFNLVPIWTALENVMAALTHSGLTRGERRDKAVHLLEKVGLGEKLGHFPSELSVGQRQRVAIARNLIIDPAVIVADEPTGGLDPATADSIIELMVEPVRAGKTSLIVATHGNFPLTAADRVLRLSEGRLA
jgi:putative ABC transport system ATP-binding protein